LDTESGCLSLGLSLEKIEAWGNTHAERKHWLQPLLVYEISERTDLPTVAQIIDLAINQREHYIRLPCLAGMELRWRQGPSAIHSLSDDALRRMLAFRLTYGADNTPDWFTHLIDQYSIAPRAAGHGVYLVLWFGVGGIPIVTDGEKKPRSPGELKTRLEAQLDTIEQQRIFVRVLDVSWPKTDPSDPL